MRKIFIGLAVMLLLGSCSKYSKMEPIAGNTYLRIFNTITNYDPRQQNSNTTQDIVSFRTLCILIDPQQDASGKFTGATTIGDFLGARPSYSGPYETHPNEDIRSYANTEWPGAYRVQTGGIVNGLDLSRWARVPSGKHRIVILRRMPPFSLVGYGTYFNQFTTAGRDTAFRTAIDTTLELSEQSIYTMELVSKSMTDAFPLRMLLRKETLDKENFSDSSAMYVNFYNYLEGSSSPASLDVYYQTEYVVNTTLASPLLVGNVPKSWATPPRSGLPYDKVQTPERLLTTITGKFSGPAPYAKMPMPPVDSFYYTQGQVLGQYRLPFDRPHTLLNFYLPGQSAATGAKPYTQLFCDEYDGQTIMDNNFVQFPPAGTLGSLYQTVTSPRGVSKSFPMVTTLTLASSYSQINQVSDGVRIYQMSLQRPAPADLLQ